MRMGIALGSNVGDRMEHLRRAWRELGEVPGVSEPRRCSPVYETEPVGSGAGEAPFLNAVAEVEYSGHPMTMLEALQAIEAGMGRPSKRPRNAPRIIDLDMLYAGNLAMINDEIAIPHPRLHLRRFVLEPLSDLRPELILPGQETTVAALLAELEEPGQVRRIPEILEP